LKLNSAGNDAVSLEVATAANVARDVRSFELVDPKGGLLPPFSPGSHVQVLTPCGAKRKYSLCNDPAERQHYVIAVKRDPVGRGGSISMVDQLQPGARVQVELPVNAFPMDRHAEEFLFIAGGIGITPILSMIRSLGNEPRRPWKLVYLTRSPEATAFIDEFARPGWAGRVLLHHDQGDPQRAFDLWPVCERPSRAHVYCCGPRQLMESVRDMTGHWSASRIHFESFTDGSAARPDDRSFLVRLAKSDRILEVPVGKSILEVLRGAGLNVPFSCESGSCGTCKTRLLQGNADHRDLVLMPDAQADNIMVCVSRAHSEMLTLDL
jgi:phthalate 4,5-dioxygenase reductase subunit